MITKEKNRSFLVFALSLLICLSMFAGQAYAADLQEGNDMAAETEMIDATDSVQETTEIVKDADGASSDMTAQEDASIIAETEGDASIIAGTEDDSSMIAETKEDAFIVAGTEDDASIAAEEEKDASVAAAGEDASLAAEQEEETPITAGTEEDTSMIAESEADAAMEETAEEEDTIQMASAEKTVTVSEASRKAAAEVKDIPEPFVRPLKDGTYIIVSKINGFKGLQPEDYLTDAGRQIEVRDCDGSDAQKFKLVGDAKTGYYSITNLLSGKNLAVKGDNAKAGAAVVQNTASSALGQKWILVEKDGYYMIQSALDGTPLTLALKNGSTGNGADAILDEVKDTASQMFSFLVSKPSVTINDGVYEIHSALNSSKKLDIAGGDMNNKGNVQLYQSNGTNAQRFIVKKVGTRKYTITSYNSGKALDLTSSSKAPGTNVQQYSIADTEAQKWILRNTGDGSLYISSAVSGLPLEVMDGKTANRTNICVNTATGSKAQQFTFTKVPDSQLQPIANGVYTLHSAKNTKRVLGVEDGSRLQRGNIQLQYDTDASFQKFNITYAGNGYYKIQNVKSKHMVDIRDGSYYSLANIQQWHDNGTMAQLWLPHKNPDGSYTFISARSSRVIDAANGSTADSTNIRTYTFNNSAAQKFKLEKTSGSDSTAINNGILKDDSVLSAMCRKAQDYYSDTYYLILCNVDQHRLVLFKEIEGRWISVLNSPISVGKASTPTPRGTFYVYNHWEYFDGDYKDDELTYQCWWSTCFYGSYYFHSVLYDYNSGYPGRLRDGRMQVNVSHGCVRMPLENAYYLYKHSPIGTKVRVY